MPKPYDEKLTYAHGGMADNLAAAVFTLGGRKDVVGTDDIHGELVDGFVRSFLHGALGYVGMDVIKPFVAYNVPY